jgi:peroxiredoxin
MCRHQLGELEKRVEAIRATGAEVLAVSGDTPEKAAETVREIGASFPLLSDPGFEVIDAYGMRMGEGLPVPFTGAEMGYAIIDRAGVLRHRVRDMQFGQNAVEIVRLLGTLGP